MEIDAANRLSRRRLMALLGTLLILLVGCGRTAPYRLYTLSSLTDNGGNTHVLVHVHHLKVKLEPVQIPKYLDRPQIITRLSPNKIKPADFDRWAEPLTDNVSRVLLENLNHLLWNDHVAVFSWIDSEEADYRISVNVTRFDGQLGKDVFLIANWTIAGKKTDNIIVEKKSVLKEASGQPNYEALVAANSRLLADLSREIAEGIRGLK